jgi:alkylation response protein AidB-like acyl-CoA dehydrogenase
MPFQAAVNDIQFLLDRVVGYEAVSATERFSDASADVTQAILTEAAKLCEDIMAPLQPVGDQNPSHLENGVVRTPPGFAEGYRAIADGGWVGISAGEEYGGMGLPTALNTAVNEMMSGACLSLHLNPLLTQGQIEALEHHASDELKALYLPKLISGEWSGTMNLTEPQAGSDVGALRTKAIPNGDGTFAITGQKIYITWGDGDFLANVCHLVLARLPDGAAGTKGISLFLVPKKLPNADGTPGAANDLRVVSLEHKLGAHGSPTAVMEYSGATGWLVGQENGGMAAMFTMMNNARLAVGAQGVGIAEASTQHALAYAMDRTQGKTNGPTGTIIEHADVRRMLNTMKADTQAARAIALACAVAIDMGRATDDPGWIARAAFLTPIAKAFGTDVGNEVAQIGVQVHGGMGFIEETGAAQYARDVRITSIYEGTNGIQAMDLVSRKMMDGGDAAFALLDEVEALAEDARGQFPEMAQTVWGAAENLRETTEWMVNEGDLNNRFAGAVPFLGAFGRVLGAHYHLKAAMADENRAPLTRFYIQRLLPRYAGLLDEARCGADGVFDVSIDDLVA